jgi:electron-transferring-flavoprotein dehydrogenase
VAETIERDVMQYDVVIVGAGPAGLACAIRLKQLKPEANVCVLEKASAVGAHSLSGAVLEPGPLEELLPEWQTEYPGMKVPATEDDFRILTPKGSYKPIPDFAVRMLPASMTYSTPFNNHGNYIVSLGQLTPWLAQKAESLGVEIFPGFAAAEAVFDEAGAVKGVRIGDMGLARDGTPGPNFTPGVEIHAPLTVLAEGCRGSVSKTLIARYDLARGHCPQTFALGYKELWQLPPGRVQPGRIEHALGWPADAHTYAGSFLYHLDNDRVYVGYIVGLDYQDPRLAAFEAFQQYKRQGAARGRRDRLGGRPHHRCRWLAVDPDAGDARCDPRRRCRRHPELRQDQGRAPGDPQRRAGRCAHRRGQRCGRIRRQVARLAGRPGT